MKEGSISIHAYTPYHITQQDLPPIWAVVHPFFDSIGRWVAMFNEQKAASYVAHHLDNFITVGAPNTDR